WRFACAPGTFGPFPVIGVRVPSVDRVGRYFHLTFVSELPVGASIVAAATTLEAFFDSAERLAVDTLADEQIDFDGFDGRVAGLSQVLTSLVGDTQGVDDPEVAAVLTGNGAKRWHMPLGTPPRLG